jgi:hypothetical protein
MAQTIGDRIQAILTRGLDAAETIAVAKLQVNNPTLNTANQAGRGSVAGQSAYVGGVGGVPGWVWLAGVGVLAVLVLPRLLRK